MVGMILLMATEPVLYRKIVDGSPIYASASSVLKKRINRVMTKRLSMMWHIGRKTSNHTIKSTTHQCIRNMGILAKCFNIYKAQLWYKQLVGRHRTLYVDYFKVGAKSARVFIEGALYTNNLEFNKLIPCLDETSEQTGHTCKRFIVIVGLPNSLQSENHNNYK